MHHLKALEDYLLLPADAANDEAGIEGNKKFFFQKERLKIMIY